MVRILEGDMIQDHEARTEIILLIANLHEEGIASN
jgi:hypothetical protein